MRPTGIKWFSQSLLGRMTVLSVVFLVLALGWFTVVPYWSYVTQEPVTLTQSRAISEVYSATNDDPVVLARLDDSVLLKEIAAANERFRLYVRHGDEEVQYGAPPRYLPSAFFLPDMFDDALIEPTEAYSGFHVEEEGATTTVLFTRSRTGENLYYEIGGITTPAPSVGNVFTAVNPMSFWFRSRNPLIAGAGVLLIAFVVLLLAARPLRTLTRAVDSYDNRTPERRLLPVEGLPTEVASLVRAINEMIERVERTREEQELFLATAAHELRTPMAVLRTRLEELPESETKETLRDDIRRMASLVDQLLRLMRIRNHRDLTDEVDLVAIARDIVAERAPLSIERGIDIELESPSETLTVTGHAGLIGVAIANLVDNAISFSEPGDTLRVSVDVTGRVAVRDWGPGIPDTELERIFEPFAKSPPNRQGHGLGLAIVRAIMTAHGGAVSARNVEGGGADFALQFNHPSLLQPA